MSVDAVKLVKVFTKQPSDPWELSIDASACLTTTASDPRDETSPGLNEEEKEQIRPNRRLLTRQPGYMGWDRTYISENELHVIYYYETIKQAIDACRNTIASNTASVLENVYDNKRSTSYQIRYDVYDKDGNQYQFKRRIEQ